MKLSEILGWENPKCHCGLTYCECIINNYTSCDREIDEESLYQVILDTYRNNGSVGCLKEYKKKIIKSMPTWLRKVDGK